VPDACLSRGWRTHFPPYAMPAWEYLPLLARLKGVSVWGKKAEETEAGPLDSSARRLTKVHSRRLTAGSTFFPFANFHSSRAFPCFENSVKDSRFRRCVCPSATLESKGCHPKYRRRELSPTS